MATEQAEVEGMDSHLRSITVTSLASIGGIAAALLSSVMTSGMSPAAAATHQPAQLVVLAVVLVQIPLYRVLGVYGEDGPGTKDYLFIAFMTFSLWFVTWGIMLETGFQV
ncbi:hypothetical protein G9464_11265 [Halostella sp. JP-L12]|uniref:EMC6-like membrane protein n=1 Tax=Halostella TaxID=1843185 RepID=UPI000EF81C2A|nr:MULTISPECIES: hypothetical protein [Halostella]NHN48176.1 hypothetical protein [Halostella sp. JP-L12]